MKHESVKTILVDIDSLLDTRIGTVSLLSSEGAKKLVSSMYFNRLIDDFETLTGGLVTNEDYLERYQRRDKETLMASRPTRIFNLLSDILKDLELQRTIMPDVSEVILGINFHPYVLDYTERSLILDIINSNLPLNVKFTLKGVDIPIDDLRPSKLKDEWDSLILYDFNLWFERHANELDTVLIPRNIIISPALFIRKFDDIAENIKELNPFRILEMVLLERVTLELIGVKEFSLLLPN